MMCGADILITDYSSVAYEFLLTDRPVVLYAPDLERYTSSREFWCDYNEFSPATIDQNFSALIDRLEHYINQGAVESTYQQVKDKLHTIQDGTSSAKIYSHMMAQLA